MDEMEDVFRDMTEMKKERHSDWHKQNMAIIKRSNIEYEIENDGYVLVINPISFSWGANDHHVKNKPQVLFYPSTGHWATRNKTFRGGAKAFLKWYEKQ